MRILGVDHGARRLGLAVSDSLGLAAHPVRCELVDGRESEIEAVARVAKELEVEKVVVGLPRSLDGSIGPRARDVIQFVEQLRPALIVPVETWDERLTTREAERVLSDAGLKRAGRKARVDTVAAQIILQAYLDAHSR